MTVRVMVENEESLRAVEGDIEYEAALWFACLRDEDVTDAVREQWAAWLQADERHRTAWRNLEALWAGVEPLGARVREPGRRAAATAAANEPAPLPATSMGNRRSRKNSAVALAASVALFLIGAAWLVLPASAFVPWAQYRTAVAEHREVTLPDGSKASLDGATALSVRFSQAERIVTLETGRAYFKVTPDRERPFIAHAADGSIRAIGTEFEVNLDDESIAVAVSEGHVKVAYASTGQQEHDLFEGQRLRIGKLNVAFDRVAPEDIGAWRTGRLVFQNAPLLEVLGSLQRYRTGRLYIADAALARRPFTGVFRSAEPDAALETIVELLDARAVRVPGAVTLVVPARNTH